MILKYNWQPYSMFFFSFFSVWIFLCYLICVIYFRSFFLTAFFRWKSTGIFSLKNSVKKQNKGRKKRRVCFSVTRMIWEFFKGLLFYVIYNILVKTTHNSWLRKNKELKLIVKRNDISDIFSNVWEWCGFFLIIISKKEIMRQSICRVNYVMKIFKYFVLYITLYQNRTHNNWLRKNELLKLIVKDKNIY